MDNDNRHWAESEETARQRIAQAQSLRKQVRTGGLKFEAYLTPDLAEWILDMVENGTFIDPSAAVFEFMQQAHDIAPYDDLKGKILRRRLDQGIQDAEEGRTYTMEEVKEHLEQHEKERTAPAVWTEIPQKLC